MLSQAPQSLAWLGGGKQTNSLAVLRSQASPVLHSALVTGLQPAGGEPPPHSAAQVSLRQALRAVSSWSASQPVPPWPVAQAEQFLLSLQAFWMSQHLLSAQEPQVLSSKLKPQAG